VENRAEALLAFPQRRLRLLPLGDFLLQLGDGSIQLAGALGNSLLKLLIQPADLLRLPALAGNLVNIL
jgi:hypothetical protein